MRNWYRRTEREADEVAWKQKLKIYRRHLNKAKKDTWRKFVEEADKSMIWTLKKYMDSISTSAYILTIDKTTCSNADKADWFSQVFFPPPPPAETADIESATYPESVPAPPQITLCQIE